MADCKGKYRNAVNQFIRLVSVDAKAYVTFIKQVKEISLQYQTDLRDANIAEVRASVKHLDGRYFDQELAIEFDKPPQATQPGDAENWDKATRAAADDVWDATAKVTNSLEDLYTKIKLLIVTTTGEMYTRIPDTPATHHSVRSSRSTAMSSTNTRGTPTVSTGRTSASARSVRGDLLRGIGSSTTA